MKKAEVKTELMAHGTYVGLPSDDDMGNSEVGHNAMGAGRIFDQGAKLVNEAIESGRLFEEPTWVELIGSKEKKGHILDAEAVHISFLEILETVVGPQENTNFLAVAQ